MRQPYWNLGWNLWALALSTVIALFLPDFGPGERVTGGVGVIIRATMVAPVVLTLLYCLGWLATYLTNRLKERWRMTTFFAGIQDGIAKAAEKRAKEMVVRAVDQAMEPVVENFHQRVEEIRKEANSRVEEAEKRAAEAAQTATRAEAEKAAKARDAERERVRRFMRSKGLAEHEINAFFQQTSDIPNTQNGISQ